MLEIIVSRETHLINLVNIINFFFIVIYYCFKIKSRLKLSFVRKMQNISSEDEQKRNVESFIMNSDDNLLQERSRIDDEFDEKSQLNEMNEYEEI